MGISFHYLKLEIPLCFTIKSKMVITKYLAKFHGNNRRKEVVNQSLKAYNIATTTTY